MKTISLIILLLATLIMFQSVLAEQCESYDTVSEQVLLDSDCDVYPDIDDNCPQVSNPEQTDLDNNGIGDACELQPTPELISVKPKLISANKLQLNYVSSRTLPKGGPGEYYTITITNPLDHAVAASITVDDIGGWGTYKVQPGRILRIDAGEKQSFNLWVKADQGATIGEKQFNANIEAEDEKVSLHMFADVTGANQTKKRSTMSGFETTIIIIIIVLLAIGLAIGFTRIKRD